MKWGVGMSKWIKVEDEVPVCAHYFGGTGFSEDVVVVDCVGDFHITSYVYPWSNSKGEGFIMEHGEEVTHWFPIPHINIED